MRRCDSAISLSTTSSSGSALNAAAAVSGSGSNSNKFVAIPLTAGAVGAGCENDNASNSLRKQGVDFLVEIEGKVMNVFGHGGLRHALTVCKLMHLYCYNLKRIRLN